MPAMRDLARSSLTYYILYTIYLFFRLCRDNCGRFVPEEIIDQLDLLRVTVDILGRWEAFSASSEIRTMLTKDIYRTLTHGHVRK